VAYRNQNGAFQTRRELLKVPKLGPKAFEQSAGFLRIRGGKNLLDNTAVHPESYSLVEAIAKDLQTPLTQITQPEQIRRVDLKKYVTDTIGEPTLRDILAELEKPGRDPRAEFTYATFKEGIKEISDLKPGMQLEGVVTNVANFGAFVDVGVHQDGLVHVSELADRFISDPKLVVKVGQVVQVRVLEVNQALKRISLSMRADAGERQAERSAANPVQVKQPQAKQIQTKQPQAQARGKAEQPPADADQPVSLDDLKARFNRKI
jgi:protein Tex